MISVTSGPIQTLISTSSVPIAPVVSAPQPVPVYTESAVLASVVPAAATAFQAVISEIVTGFADIAQISGIGYFLWDNGDAVCFDDGSYVAFARRD